MINKAIIAELEKLQRKYRDLANDYSGKAEATDVEDSGMFCNYIGKCTAYTVAAADIQNMIAEIIELGR